MDGAFMEPGGRNRWQPVANGTPPKNRSNKPIRNQWQPTATAPERMVRRGSTVRALQSESIQLDVITASRAAGASRPRSEAEPDR
jgi:hypothetical protein